jgi:hypothetical protein
MLRALAAILVVFHHTTEHYSRMGGTNPVLLFVGRFGFTGVDIFFVISGYVIAHTTRSIAGTATNIADFFERRFFRIYLRGAVRLCGFPAPGGIRDRLPAPAVPSAHAIRPCELLGQRGGDGCFLWGRVPV